MRLYEYEEPMIEIEFFWDDIDVITTSGSTGGLENIGGDTGEDSGDFEDLQ